MERLKMAIHKLAPRFIETVRKDGLYGDGGGLWLQVRSSGRARSWIFRYVMHSKARVMGLGPLDTIGLAEARERARACRQQVHDGIDPLDARKERQVAAQIEAASHVTLRVAAQEYMDRNASSWAPSTACQAERMIRTYLYQSLGDLPVHAINVGHVHAVLKPIHETKPPTSKTVRMYLEGILAWATAREYRKGDNPATWSGPISTLLPNVKKIHSPTHLAALPFNETGKFVADLRAHREGWSGTERPVPAYILEFIILILTAVRKHQAVFAKWNEIDFEARVWTCQPPRTKAGKKTGKPHIIFLNAPAMEILRAMRGLQEKEGTGGEYVFVHRRTVHHLASRHVHWTGRTFSCEAINRFLGYAFQRPDLTVHGFRTTFRSWAAENGHDEHAAEMALDHVVGNAVRNIYARDATLAEKRRHLMDAWGADCDRPERLDGKIIPMRSAK